MTFKERMRSVTVNGAIDLSKLEEAEGSCGYNGGSGCDVYEGPCSCGAWHTPEERREERHKAGKLYPFAHLDRVTR